MVRDGGKEGGERGAPKIVIIIVIATTTSNRGYRCSTSTYPWQRHY